MQVNLKGGGLNFYPSQKAQKRFDVGKTEINILKGIKLDIEQSEMMALHGLIERSVIKS